MNLPPVPETDPPNKPKTITVEVHGLKAKIRLNRPEEDLVPAYYLQKAEQTPAANRTIWLFRGREDARNVNLSKWSTVDTRFRGVYKTLKKVPAEFATGIYEDDGNSSSTSNERGSTGSSSSSSSSSPRVNFTEAAKAQGQVVYALLHEILDLMKISRRMGDASFVLRPRLFSSKLEYWTGYRERYTDGPRTAALLCIDEYPETGLVRVVVPISSTQSETPPPTLHTTLTNEFKLLLSQLLLHIHHLYPPGDQIPSQEVYLISQHGPKLHLLRGIFPGSKTSRLWSGRYNNNTSGSGSGSAGENSAGYFAATNPQGGRYYGGANMERVRQELEWLALCDAVGGDGGDDDVDDEEKEVDEADVRTFRVLGSREFDLWVGRDFRDVVRLLGGLGLYLVSGRARCGVLQGVLGEEGREKKGEKKTEEDERKREREREKEEQKKKEEEIAAEEKKLEEIERLAREEIQERDAISEWHEVRQSWWDRVWDEGREDGLPEEEDELGINRL